ncbi:MAG: (p)ppGpp synthetase [Eggerthellaceae bacterium]|jgi:putative GTP pyrophosphokinase|nr:(p)ppGpp synthetase [Eggerthellaceae bacterium]MDR2715178.1 GTP pyrophosphokinase family protein [Coriobacteriaceae bacterium]
MDEETSFDEISGKLTAKNLKKYRAFEKLALGTLPKYQAAMQQMEVRLKILDQDMKSRRHRSPIHHIESRLKTPLSVFEKLERYGKQVTIQNMRDHVMDVAGLRVICSYVQDVYNIFECLQKQDDLTIVAVKDYIAEPKPNGYRCLHIIVKIAVYFIDEKEEIPVEIQLRTIAMNFWASLEHDLKYKAVRDIKGINTVDELRICSRVIEDVEARMQILAHALESE